MTLLELPDFVGLAQTLDIYLRFHNLRFIFEQRIKDFWRLLALVKEHERDYFTDHPCFDIIGGGPHSKAAWERAGDMEPDVLGRRGRPT
jgi:hypothetical protein